MLCIGRQTGVGPVEDDEAAAVAAGAEHGGAELGPALVLLSLLVRTAAGCEAGPGQETRGRGGGGQGPQVHFI